VYIFIKAEAKDKLSGKKLQKGFLRLEAFLLEVSEELCRAVMREWMTSRSCPLEGEDHIKKRRLT
jgi:hypothetical protein